VSAQSRVFDPGIDPVEDDETELLLEAVEDVIRSRGSRPLPFREGEFRAAGTPTKIINVLFDTGALHKSYISSDLVERNREKWKDCIFPHRAVACLADQATRIETNEVMMESQNTQARWRLLYGPCLAWSSSWVYQI